MRLGAVFTRHHAVKVSRRLPVAVALLVLAGSAGYRWTNAPAGRHPQVAARSVSPATTATGPAAPRTSAQATTTTTTTGPPSPRVVPPAPRAPVRPPPSRTVASPPALSPCGTGGEPPARYTHVVWIWMENRSYRQVVGNPAAPYATALARQCGTDSAYHTVGSPSLPNYLGATSGDSGAITDDGGPAVHPQTGDNLFRQVRAGGGTARSYVESMPTNCAVAPQGRYAVKHNPAAYYTGGDDRHACVADDVPMGTTTAGALASDLSGDRMPTFAFVVPDLCHDTHDCPVSAGDAWLAAWLPRILRSGAYQTGTTAVFVVWDEYTPVPNIVISPTTRPGTTSTIAVNHYSLLRTTEELLGLPLLGNAATAPGMAAPFHLE